MDRKPTNAAELVQWLADVDGYRNKEIRRPWAAHPDPGLSGLKCSVCGEGFREGEHVVRVGGRYPAHLKCC
jgi:hypothetical protein